MLHGFARSPGPLMTLRDRGDSEFSARIWLTLTKPSSDGIAARLRKRNFDVLNRPVTRIEELPRPQISSEISLADKNVFLSQHAARIVLSICEEDGIPLTGRFFAIGNATAAAIESKNSRLLVGVPKLQSSTGLLNLLELLPKSSGGELRQDETVTIFCGEDGKDQVARALEQNCIFRETYVYRRKNAEYEEVNISEIDVIICGSLHALRAIHDNHEAQLKAKDLPMVVVSARIAVLASKLGYRRIICSRGTNIESIVACVTGLNIR